MTAHTASCTRGRGCSFSPIPPGPAATSHLSLPYTPSIGIKSYGPGSLASLWLQAGHAQSSSAVVISMTNIINVIISHNSWALALPAGKLASHSQQHQCTAPRSELEQRHSRKKTVTGLTPSPTASLCPICLWTGEIESPPWANVPGQQPQERSEPKPDDGPLHRLGTSI